MLNHWGYRYLGIGTALAYMEVDLQNHRRETPGALAVGHGTSEIEPRHPVAKFIVAKCDEVLKLATELPSQDLGAIPNNVEILKAKFLQRERHPRGPALFTNDVLADVEHIKNDFIYILSKRRFYAIKPEFDDCYGRPELFGKAVARKFPKARFDIERAGNCLALGEPTACVLHLDRALESAVHYLAKKLGITPRATQNMGGILGDMSEPIKKLPDSTERQKRKKEKWAECRTNLYHVKMAWRDPSAHGKQRYDEKDAPEIFRRVKDFMQQLATL